MVIAAGAGRAIVPAYSAVILSRPSRSSLARYCRLAIEVRNEWIERAAEAVDETRWRGSLTS